MAAKLLALRGLRLAGGVVEKDAEFTCDDVTAAELMGSGKAVPADDRTKARVKERKVAWTEATVEAAGAKSWVNRGR